MKPDGRMFFILKSCLIVVILFCSSRITVAGELGHYMPGVASIRDFVMPPEPGFYYVQYNLYYTTDTYKDRDGNSVDSINIGPVILNIEAGRF